MNPNIIAKSELPIVRFDYAACGRILTLEGNIVRVLKPGEVPSEVAKREFGQFKPAFTNCRAVRETRFLVLVANHALHFPRPHMLTVRFDHTANGHTLTLEGNIVRVLKPGEVPSEVARHEFGQFKIAFTDWSAVRETRFLVLVNNRVLHCTMPHMMRNAR